MKLQHLVWFYGLICLLLAQGGCSRTRETQAPAGADDAALPSVAPAVEGLWDEDGTVEGYEKMIQHYGSVLQSNSADITALSETAYAYSKLAWIRHLNAQYSLHGKLGANTTPPGEVDSLYGKADEFLVRAKDIDASRDSVLAVESIGQRSKGRNRQALSLAQQAYQPDSRDPRVLEAYEIATIDDKEIRDLYKRIVSIAPRNAYYWWQLGNFEKDSDAMSAAYQNALELSPGYALAKISLAMSKWILSRDRIKGLAEIAKASPEFDAVARYNRLLSLVEAGGSILIWLLLVIMLRAGSLNWLWLVAIYSALWCLIRFGPAIGDRTILIPSLRDTLAFVIWALGILLFWDLLRAWRSPYSDLPLARLARRAVRGMLAPVRTVFGISIDRSRADVSYLVVFAELWLLNVLVQQVFARLIRWW